MVTIASPTIAEWANEYSKTNGGKLKIEASTIINQTSPSVISYWTQLESCKKLCLPIYVNRDIKQVKKIQDHLIWHTQASAEVLVNEFCVSYGNNCPYRQDCYASQAHGGKINYFNKCSAYRAMTPSAWLKAPTIFPEWIREYAELTGVWNYKLSGEHFQLKCY